MKKEDLMIGDWYYWEAEGKMYPYQVTAEDFVKGEIPNFQPVLLTSEILEKNGFKKKVWWKYRESDVITYAIGDGFHIELSEDEFWLVDNCIDSGDYGYESNWIVEVKYVHELQHVLRLCKIEKEIVL